MKALDRITISNGIATITMPKVRVVSVGGESVYSEVEMASGRKVRDIVGFRPAVSAKWDWVPASTMAALHAMLRSGEYLFVEYPDPVEGDASGYFDVNYPTSETFQFVDGEARWHNVSLTMTAQGVV